MEKELKCYKTKYRQKMDERDIAVYHRYKELMAVEGAMKCGVREVIMEEFGIHSLSTVLFIVRRIETRIAAGEKFEHVKP